MYFHLPTIIPILQVLFKVNTQTYEFMAWKGTDHAFIDVVLNNVNWYVTALIETYGGSYTYDAGCCFDSNDSIKDCLGILRLIFYNTNTHGCSKRYKKQY